MVKSGDFWIGILVGAAAGAATALLTAPKKGVEMRGDIANGTQEIGRKAGAAWGDVKDKASDLVGGAKKQAAQAADKSKEFAGSARDRFQKAVTAGKEAATSKKAEMNAELQSEKQRIGRAA